MAPSILERQVTAPTPKVTTVRVILRLRMPLPWYFSCFHQDGTTMVLQILKLGHSAQLCKIPGVINCVDILTFIVSISCVCLFATHSYRLTHHLSTLETA